MKLCTAVQEGCGYKDTLRASLLCSVGKIFHCVLYLSASPRTSAIAIDNIFIDVSHNECYTVTLIMNRVSDLDDQLLIIGTDCSHVPIHTVKTARKINKYTISDFINKLSGELWDFIFSSDDVNAMFNSFFNNYLRIFYSSFPLKK